jgi:hypothetical protein
MGPYPEPRRDLPIGTVEVDRPPEICSEDDGRWTAVVAPGIDGLRPPSRAQWCHLGIAEQKALLALMAELSLRAIREGQEAGGNDNEDGVDEDPS